MNKINEYKKRFNQLMESKMGNVKPLINEHWGDEWRDGYTYYSWAVINGYATAKDPGLLDDPQYKSFDKWNYNKIENSSNPDDIATLIVQSDAPIGVHDTEAVSEAAFMALAKNPGWYGSVKKAMGGTDPYKYCEGFMTTSKVYHRQSVDTSYGIIKKKNPKLT